MFVPHKITPASTQLLRSKPKASSWISLISQSHIHPYIKSYKYELQNLSWIFLTISTTPTLVWAIIFPLDHNRATNNTNK